MKLNSNFITHTTKGEHYMVSTGDIEFKGILKNNNTAAFIIECLKSQITENEIIDKLLEKYSNVSYEIAKKDVHDIIEQLRSIGAVEE